MKLLLDTHIWLWSLLEPERLGKGVRKVLASSETERWLSPISVWEFLLLVEKRRISVRTRPEDWLEEAFSKAPITEAPLTRDVAIRSRSLRLPQEDPADRFLAATAQVYDLTLVTDDDDLLKGHGFRKLANR